MTKEQYRPVILIAALCLFALLIRLIYLIELSRFPLFDTVLATMDHFNFDQGALNFSKGDWLARSPNNSYSPLYKYFLGTIYYLSDRNFYVVYSVQFVMGAVSSVLVFLIAREIFGFRTGILAYLGFTLYGTQIVYEGIILRASFITFLGLLSFYLLSGLKSRPKETGGLLAATFVLSLFFQSRPNTLLCLPLICLYLNRHVFSSLNPSETIRQWGIFAGTLIVTFIPILIQCYLVHGRFVFMDASGPMAFIMGNLTSHLGVGYEHQLVKPLMRGGYGSAIGIVIQEILNNPLGFLELYIRKVYFFFSDFEPPSNISVYLYKELSVLQHGLLNHFSLYTSLGLLGLGLSIKNKKNVFLLNGYFFGLFLSVVLFYVVARFRVPFAPFLIIYSAYGLHSIIEWIFARKIKMAIAAGLAVLALMFAFRTPDNALPIRQVDYGNLSMAFFNNEPRFDLKLAEDFGLKCWELEIRTDLNHQNGKGLLATIYNLYGYFLWKKGDYSGAEKVLQRSSMVYPFNPISYRLLANLDLELERNLKALNLLHTGRVANPSAGELYDNLVRQYVNNPHRVHLLRVLLNKWIEFETDPKMVQFLKEELEKQRANLPEIPRDLNRMAKHAQDFYLREQWQKALEGYETLNRHHAVNAEWFFEQGLVLEKLGRQEEAVTSFYEALLIDPSDRQVHKHLADHFLPATRLCSH